MSCTSKKKLPEKTYTEAQYLKQYLWYIKRLPIIKPKKKK